MKKVHKGLISLIQKKISTMNNDEKKNYSMHLCQNVSSEYISYNFISSKANHISSYHLRIEKKTQGLLM